jgi:hypothetical protein
VAQDSAELLKRPYSSHQAQPHFFNAVLHAVLVATIGATLHADAKEVIGERKYQGHDEHVAAPPNTNGKLAQQCEVC